MRTESSFLKISRSRNGTSPNVVLDKWEDSTCVPSESFCSLAARFLVIAQAIQGVLSVFVTNGEIVEMALVEFGKHRESVRKLVNFDRDILDFVIDSLREHVSSMRAAGVNNPNQTGEKLLRMLEPVRKNDALRPRYETVFNQALVLLVSYFASAVHTLFRDAIRKQVALGSRDTVLAKERLHFIVAEMCEPGFELPDAIPNALIQANDISWQDMQSIHRAFKKYFEIDMLRDGQVNDIIAAQACRHVIVHAAGIVNERTIKQLSNAQPRTLKTDIKLGGRVQFSTDEIERAGAAMGGYLDKLACKVDAATMES